MADAMLDVRTPLGFTVRCTQEYWDFIVSEKHPAMAGRIEEVRLALGNPDEVRRSKMDPTVLLFYRGLSPRWVCAVVKQQDGTGFLITAYPTDAIKTGEVVWKKSS